MTIVVISFQSHHDWNRHMTTPAKSKHERALEAEIKASRYLADANALAEQGNTAEAELLYEKGQFWLDRYNKLAGNT